ncbi:MAG: hypothetical protein JXA92_06790 [candidate division Zixibacteria bacterium]|nr:hypothetical protein [candidate division Zixibacteria bacterium]
MSKIIKKTLDAPAIFIGERQHDLHAEANAEGKLRSLFPMVAVMTSPDGAKLIPVQEVNKIEAEYYQGKREAYDEGYKVGFEAGNNKGLNEARQILGQFEQAIKEAVNQRAALLEEAKQKILELVVKISRKVTMDAVEIDREATALMIARIIDELIDRSQLKVKVNPHHLPVVEQNIARFLSANTALKEITFEADPRVRYGGCFIETPGGDIDARLESQFEVISEVVQKGEDEN